MGVARADEIRYFVPAAKFVVTLSEIAEAEFHSQASELGILPLFDWAAEHQVAAGLALGMDYLLLRWPIDLYNQTKYRI